MQPRIYYDSRLVDGALAASTTAAGYHADNVLDWRPYTWWKPTALPATLTVDCGSAKAADYALIYGHDLHTQSATVEVRGSTDNFSGSNVLIASSTPTTSAPVLLSFASVSYRYWRLRVTGTTMPSLAIVSIGAALQLPGYLGVDFDPTARRLIGQTNRNANGQPLGKVLDYTEQQRTLTMRRVTWTWLRSTFLPAWRAHLRSSPFAFAWNLTYDPTNIVLATAGDDLTTPHSAGQWADVSFTITNVADE